MTKTVLKIPNSNLTSNAQISIFLARFFRNLAQDNNLMATHKSAKKRIRTSERKRIANKNAASKVKSSLKKVFASNNKEEAEKLYKEAVSILDKNSTKGRIPKNNASRKKSQLTKHLNSLKPAETETKE